MSDAQPRYQDLPSLSSFDYGKLRESIRENGVLEPVVVDENDHTLDGHHRLRICAELGLDCPKRVLSGLTEDEKRSYAFMVNVARRQMSVQERRAMWKRHRDEIEASLRKNPAQSNRAVAEAAGTDHHTVAKRRQALEQTGEIPAFQAEGGRGIRTGTAVAEPPDPDTRHMANHRGLMSFEVILNVPNPSEEIRTRDGLPYVKESQRVCWSSGELYLTMGAWKNEADAYVGVVELANRLFKEVRERPLPTMPPRQS